MNQQELQIAVWRDKFMQEAANCAAAFVEANLQRERADALQKALDALGPRPPIAVDNVVSIKEKENGIDPATAA